MKHSQPPSSDTVWWSQTELDTRSRKVRFSLGGTPGIFQTCRQKLIWVSQDRRTIQTLKGTRLITRGLTYSVHPDSEVSGSGNWALAFGITLGGHNHAPPFAGHSSLLCKSTRSRSRGDSLGRCSELGKEIPQKLCSGLSVPSVKEGRLER